MKRSCLLVSALLLAALFLLPSALIRPVRQAPEETETDEPPAQEEESRMEGGRRDSETVLRVLRDGTVEEMELDAYLEGVVRAEMPASFELEALKAQAVAARTYTLYHIRMGSSHAEADVCTDSTCCQAWLDKAAAAANWGENGAAYEEKVHRAVAETDGEAVLYDGQPVLAVFHSSSAGVTRSAGAVWQNDLPYLRPVASPEPVELIPNYYSRAEFAAADFRTRIQARYPQAALNGAPEQWLKNAVVDEAGSVDTVEVGGVTVRGSVLRSLLELRSACFEWQVEDGKLVFFVTGYGHGVGMSQFGANRMAREGAGYREILTHYYTGVTVGLWGDGSDFTKADGL